MRKPTTAALQIRDQRGRAMLSILLFAATASLALAEELPTYTIQRSGSAIQVDGRLDEPAWLAASAVGRFQFPWWQAGKKEQTVAKLLYDDRHLYLAYLCQDAHISAVHTE